tara:strand:+ start:6555 stop:8033 length:1479 start_codon:yes stop_codon:yes gene_type:complete
MIKNRKRAILTVAEMYRADASVVASGIPGQKLMEAAGKAVADVVIKRGYQKVAVLCGPGNNGGDGFVTARYLADAGIDVKVALLGELSALKDDARLNAGRWAGYISELLPSVLMDVDCIIDAVFGAGLSRELDSVVGAIIDAADGIPCIAVDVPSGVQGDTGQILGKAFKALETITFFRPKPGHVLFPGCQHCGKLTVVDIGIPETVLDEINPKQWYNEPDTWRRNYPFPGPADHKYSRGHAVVVGGSEMTGAARLAVYGAMRAGTGIVSVAVPSDAAVIYRLSLPGAITRIVRDTGTFSEIIEKERVTACLVGPGNGVTVATREKTLAALRKKLPVVLDADAISVFEETRELLFDSIKSPCLMTPHEGEFSRLFEFEGDKITRARKAAARSGAAILLKGSDTVIAAPDGRVAINVNGPPDLATAGSGDVLAGIAVGLLAHGLEPFDAACMAAWVHGEAARTIGPGLIAEDLPNALPAVLKKLKKNRREVVR